jgi:Leucine Rich repeat/Leucine Rich Repeat
LCDDVAYDFFVHLHSSLKNLEELYVSHCQLGDDNLRPIADCFPQLQVLDLSNNCIESSEALVSCCRRRRRCLCPVCLDALCVLFHCFCIVDSQPQQFCIKKGCCVGACRSNEKVWLDGRYYYLYLRGEVCMVKIYTV